MKLESINNHIDDIADLLICGIMLVEFETQKIVYVNKVAQDMIGKPSSEIVGEDCTNFIYPEKTDALNNLNLDKTINDSEHLIIAKDGKKIPILKTSNSIDIDGKTYVFKSFISIEKQKQHELQLKKIGFIDQLTGLYNRHYMSSILMEDISTSSYKKSTHCLIMLDVDNFKNVNDVFGHDIGDIVLKNLAQIVIANVRKTDIIVRWGGEEIVVFLKDTPLQTAFEVSEKIRKAVEIFEFEKVGNVTISLGIAEYIKEEPFDSWFKRVDFCLLRAKNLGKNCSITWDGTVNIFDLDSKLVWKTDYICGREMIDNDHLHLFEASLSLINAIKPSTTFEELTQSTDSLISLIMQHFKREEEELLAINYPYIKNHKQIHRDLIENSINLRNSMSSYSDIINKLVVYIIVEAIIEHLHKEDIKFFEYCLEK